MPMPLVLSSIFTHHLCFFVCRYWWLHFIDIWMAFSPAAVTSAEKTNYMSRSPPRPSTTVAHFTTTGWRWFSWPASPIADTVISTDTIQGQPDALFLPATKEDPTTSSTLLHYQYADCCISCSHNMRCNSTHRMIETIKTVTVVVSCPHWHHHHIDIIIEYNSRQ